jgi:hypothetical protein
MAVAGLDLLVDLGRRLPDQEQAAGDQDQVAPGEGELEGEIGRASCRERVS